MPSFTHAPLKPPPPGGFPRGHDSIPLDEKLKRMARAVPFLGGVSAPIQVAHVPEQLSYWGNDRYGDCVSAEEAFSKGCSPAANPKGVFIPDSVVIAWARNNGWLNGASLDGVLADMKARGYVIDSQAYNDGDFQSVDISNESILQAALAVGPVKIAINANALPSGAGSTQGWTSFGDNSNTRTDHCVPIYACGRADFVYDALKITRPTSIPADRLVYGVFSWSTMGIVDKAWIDGCCDGDCWVRSPTTVGVPPLPIPNPTPTPVPPGPGPIPAPVQPIELTIDQPMPAGRYLLFPNTPV